MTTETELGIIEVSCAAISSIASQAVLESYGVVGMASKSFKDGLVELLAPSASHRGIDVHLADGQVVIDLYVIIEYGTRISEVGKWPIILCRPLRSVSKKPLVLRWPR
jgi:uncharacterized alkaline shock family protein YloU